MKKAKCERTGIEASLNEMYLCFNINDSEWKLLHKDAPDRINDYHFQISRAIKSPYSFIDWMAHLNDKTWFDSEQFFEFFRRVRKENKLYNAL